ncbi:hypothetical protein VCHENC02_2044A, partial [Vibrio harveyi]
MHCLIP